MRNLDRITTDPARMSGEPCIRNMRLTVRRVLEALAKQFGWKTGRGGMGVACGMYSGAYSASMAEVSGQ